MHRAASRSLHGGGTSCHLAGLAVAVLAWIRSPKGCRIAPAGTGGVKSSDPFLVWHDPREHAFSAEVPAGWTVSGGLFRFASVDVRPAIEVVSPEGKIRVTARDAEIPGFAAPNPMLEMTGFREWRKSRDGPGVQSRKRLRLLLD